MNELNENALLNLNTAFLSSYIKITVRQGLSIPKTIDFIQLFNI